MLPRLLVTGFEPFAHYAVNPSWLAAERMEREFFPEVRSRCLPVDFHLARERLIAILDELQPATVLSMGLAAGDEFRIECCARKVNEFGDLFGMGDHRITMNRDVLAGSLSRLNVPWRFSDDAGQYVCESTYWVLLEYASVRTPTIPCGFLHVPAESEQWPVSHTIEIVREVVRDLLAARNPTHSDNRLA